MHIDTVNNLWIGDVGFPLWWLLLAIVIFIMCPLLYRWLNTRAYYARCQHMNLDHEIHLGDMVEWDKKIRPVIKIIQQYYNVNAGNKEWIVKVHLGRPIRFVELRRKLAEWWDELVRK